MKATFIFLAFLFLYHSVINAQRADIAINNYAAQSPLESVYLQFDNSLYTPADTIWFKAYILANMVPSSFSKNLYVDWYNGEGQIIYHQVYPVQAGSAFGQFPVPEDYKEKSLHMMAYTRWMLNNSSGFLFHKDISIILPGAGKKEQLKKQPFPKEKTSLQFFPEGGNLVSGIINKIAFKATGNYGNPVSAQGIIKDKNGNTVTTFTSSHDGMGFFFLTPKNNENYTADWQTQQGPVTSVPLPVVQSSGLTMEVLLETGSRKVIIRKNSAIINHIHLLVTMNGLVDYLSAINLSEQDSAVATIPVNDVPPGILTFTVLDEQWNPLAERISFVKNGSFLQPAPSISVTEKDIQKRGYNSFDLHYNDSTIADLSIAVTDADIPADTSSDIISYFLLTGQLRGKINQPAYYFSDTSLQLQEQLDLVMLTNGWRKYQWKEIIAGTTRQMQYMADRNYFFLSGKVNDQRKMPKEVSFLVKNNEELAGYTFSVKADGSFSDSSMIIFDSVTVSYQPGSKKRNIPMAFDQLLQPAFTIYPFQEVLPPQGSGHPGSQKKNENDYYFPLGKVLATVKIYTPTKTEMDKIEDKYASNVFKNTPGYRVFLENNPILYSSGSLIELLKARIPNLNESKSSPPYVFIDENMVPLEVANETLIFSDIAFVKYYRSYFVLAPGGGGVTDDTKLPRGVIAIYTKKFSPEDIREHNREGTYHINGYTLAKEFYSPDYSMSDSIADDRRKTLLWRPSLLLGKNHNNDTISFYNNDYAKRFRVIVEGIKSDGTIIHEEKIIE